LVNTDRRPAIAADASAHLREARHAVRLAEQRPGLRNPQRCEVAVEPTTDYTVVRLVGLEEEWLAHGEHTKLSVAARPPEVHLCDARACSEVAIPIAVRHADIRPHTTIM